MFGLVAGRNSLDVVPEVKCAKISAQFIKLFEERFGTLLCKELKHEKKREFCASLVQQGTEIAVELINNSIK